MSHLKIPRSSQFVVIKGDWSRYRTQYLRCQFPWKGKCPVDRRFKVFYLDRGFIEATINWKQAEYIQLPIFNDLPEDATFHHVHYDDLRQAFGIIVHSEEFDVIEEGTRIPEVDGILKFQTVQLSIKKPC